VRFERQGGRPFSHRQRCISKSAGLASFGRVQISMSAGIPARLSFTGKIVQNEGGSEHWDLAILGPVVSAIYKKCC
jgi:hypothetical protein